MAAKLIAGCFAAARVALKIIYKMGNVINVSKEQRKNIIFVSQTQVLGGQCLSALFMVRVRAKNGKLVLSASLLDDDIELNFPNHTFFLPLE